MRKAKRIFKQWNCEIDGHKYRPRYDTILPNRRMELLIAITDLEEMKDKIYVRDVCVHCGDVIER